MGEFTNISKEAIKGMLRKYSNPSERVFVKQTLLRGGCPSYRIKEAENDLSQGIGRQLLNIKISPKENVRERIKERHYINRTFFMNLISNRLTWYVCGGILLILILFLLIAKYGSNCDEQCFVDKANNCEKANYEKYTARFDVEFNLEAA